MGEQRAALVKKPARKANRAPQEATPAHRAPVQRKAAAPRAEAPETEAPEIKSTRATAPAKSLTGIPVFAPKPAANGVPAIVREVLRSPGQPLDQPSREFFEPRFGYDFSQVRVHADGMAAESAKSVNAVAYAVGHNVVFGAGLPASGSGTRQRLLAHELTHVVQQSTRGASGSSVFIEDSPRAENEADRTAEQVVSGEMAGFSPASPASGLQRAPATVSSSVDSMSLDDAVKSINSLPPADQIKVLKRWQASIGNRIDTGEQRIRELMSLRAESFSNWLIGGTIEVFGLTSLPSDDWTEPSQHLRAANDTMAKGQVHESIQLLQAATEATTKQWDELNAYLEATGKGGDRSIFVLHGLEAAGAIAATIATGGVAAEAELGLLGASTAVGVVGGTYGASQEFSGQVGEKVAGTRKNFELAPILKRGAADAITNFVGALAGGALTKYASRMFGSYLSEIGEDELLALGRSRGLKGALPRDFFLTTGQRMIAEFLGGAGSVPLTTAVSIVVNRLSGKEKFPSASEFTSMVIKQMIQAGALQLFLGALLHAHGELSARGGEPPTGSAGGSPVGEPGGASVVGEEMPPPIESPLEAQERQMRESKPGLFEQVEDLPEASPEIPLDPTAHPAAGDFEDRSIYGKQPGRATPGQHTVPKGMEAQDPSSGSSIDLPEAEAELPLESHREPEARTPRSKGITREQQLENLDLNAPGEMSIEAQVAITAGLDAEKIQGALRNTVKNTNEYTLTFSDPIRQVTVTKTVIPDFVPAARTNGAGQFESATDAADAVLFADSKYTWDATKQVALDDQIRAMLVLARRSQKPFVFLLRESGDVSSSVREFAAAIGTEMYVVPDASGLIR